MKNELIVSTGAGSDLDGYACSVGYAELLNKIGRPATAISVGEIDKETKFVLSLIGGAEIEKTSSITKDAQIILVDTTNSKFLNIDADPKQVVEIIDHRKVNDAHLFPWAKVQVELVGSCATLIVEKFIEESIEPSMLSAYLLYGAIVSNTVNFKNQITLDRDIKAADYLKTLIDIPEDFVEKMFRAKTDIEGGNLKLFLESDYLEREVLGKCIVVFQPEIVETEHLIENRSDEVKSLINAIVKDKNLDYYLINIIDTLEGYNHILVFDSSSQKLLENILNIKFENGIAKINHILMRKEIMGKIKDYLEKN